MISSNMLRFTRQFNFKSAKCVTSSLVRHQSSSPKDLVLIDVNDKTGIATVSMNSLPVNSLNLELLSAINNSLDILTKDNSRGMILTSVSLYNRKKNSFYWIVIFRHRKQFSLLELTLTKCTSLIRRECVNSGEICKTFGSNFTVHLFPQRLQSTDMLQLAAVFWPFHASTESCFRNIISAWTKRSLELSRQLGSWQRWEI